jgi:lysozyme
MKFNKRINEILEQIDLPPEPPAIVQQHKDTILRYQEVYTHIEDHEGYFNKVYIDSVGKPTIGIGLNLMRPEARSFIKQVGANYERILAGQEILNDKQIKDLFNMQLQVAYKDVKLFMPNFDQLPKNVKLVLVDMAFNLGGPRLGKFKNTKQLIATGNYQGASREILHSKWAKQVGRRAVNDSKLLSS